MLLPNEAGGAGIAMPTKAAKVTNTHRMANIVAMPAMTKTGVER